MKPKDLKSPFIWEERHVFFDHDQKVIYVPLRCERKNLTDDLTNLFDSFSEIHLEYCSGNGEWIHQRALENPNILWIALEKQFKRVRKIWSKSQNSNLNNLWIVCAEALDFTENYLPEDLFDKVYIHFPDPWPKKKHAKFRLMQPSFVKQLARILKGGGEIQFLTDNSDYSLQSIKALLEEDVLSSKIASPFYHSKLDEYGTSYFCRLWQEKKRSFYFSKFQKTCKY